MSNGVAVGIYLSWADPWLLDFRSLASYKWLVQRENNSVLVERKLIWHNYIMKHI